MGHRREQSLHEGSEAVPLLAGEALPDTVDVLVEEGISLQQSHVLLYLGAHSIVVQLLVVCDVSVDAQHLP